MKELLAGMLLGLKYGAAVATFALVLLAAVTLLAGIVTLLGIISGGEHDGDD